MSEFNGDRARFQKERKAGLVRRERARAVHAEMKRQAAASQLPGDSGPAGGAPGPLDASHPEKPVVGE
jgi:hypothetical protein